MGLQRYAHRNNLIRVGLKIKDRGTDSVKEKKSRDLSWRQD